MEDAALVSRWLLLIAASACVLTGCAGPGESSSPGVRVEPFGKGKFGEPVQRFTLTNAKRMKVVLISHGAAIAEVHVPDRDGRFADVTLGFDDMAGYLSQRNRHFGCTIGRVANRIAGAKFTLDGKTYQLAANNGPHSLHGGQQRPFDEVVWNAEPFGGETERGVRFSYHSPDGEEGYPGNADAAVTYTLNDKNELTIEYTATTDRRTPLNMTNHAYWNLAGHGQGTILDHELLLAASRYTPVDPTLIPTGDIESVEGTPLDFTVPRRIGERAEQLGRTPAGGYDHNFVLEGDPGRLRLAARLREPRAGRVMEVLTTEPGIQFYAGNFLNGQAGKGGKKYARHGALCLEAQHYPDSVNQPAFPSIILNPDETYRQTTVYRFSVD